jgi:hypothetical protein
MTSFKFLVMCCGLLAAAWSPGQASTTTDPDNTAEVTGAPSTDTTTTTTHHRRHHRTATTASTSTNSTTAAKSGDDSASESKKTKTASTTAKSAKDKEESSGTNASTASTTGASHRHKKLHPASTETAYSEQKTAKSKVKPVEGEKTEATTKTSTTPASAEATTNTAPAAPVSAAAAAATVVNGSTAVATPGKGRHHRHSKSTTETAAERKPEPPIVITTVNVPPLSSVPAPAPLGTPPASNSIVPTVETGLPVPRPGAGTTATLPLALIRSSTSAPVDTHFTFEDAPAAPRATHTYPWKSRIVTTVFWIGEGSTPLSGMTNKMSAWDMNWVHDNGGADDQYDLNGYASGSHASLINPFYVALPFNDLAYPDKTERWLPPGWYKPTHHGDKPVSACQGRWIEIKNSAGRTCFAQWEDVGPINTDDAEYVFGPYRPSATRGLDVSPAVAKYLGIDSTAITSWRFVDDDDVQPGMWLRYNEEAILFQALKEQSRHNTPIQDLSQPVPDGSDDNASQKKIGAARG